MAARTAAAPSARSRPSVDASSHFRHHHELSKTPSSSPLGSHPARFCVSVGPAVFCACWVAILLFHAACLAFCVGAAWVYAKVPGTMLAYLITVKSLAIDIKHFPLVSNVYAVIAAGHTFFIVNMMVMSVANRQLVFFWWPDRIKAPGGRRQSRFRSITSIAPTIASVVESAPPPANWTPPGGKRQANSAAQSGPTLDKPRFASMPTIAALMMARSQIVRARATVNALFGRTGLFGVNGRHFERIMLMRELGEASLQTMQAYELARLLPRLMLVRAYVAMLVVNCWSTLLLHRLVGFNLPLRRMVCLVCDLLLDFASVIGVWSMLVYRYVRQYDPVQTSFPITLLTNDVWYVNFINDFRLVLISSWVDLGSQVAFFVSMFGAINNVKLLLHRRTNAPVDTALTAVAVATERRRRNGVDPHHTIRNSADATASRQLDVKIRSTAQVERFGAAFTRLLQVLIALLGGVILAAHAYAETRPTVPGCRLEVLTWFRSQSGCALLEIDCYHTKMTGSQPEITTELHRVAAVSLEHLALVHCPSLHVPPAIQELHQLRVLKIYNSTIEQWDADAALTKAHHPDLGVFIVARVNMTDQRLPAGLLSPEFPPTLVSIQFSVVNLATLPDELVTIWPRRLSLFWESSGLTCIPQTLVQMPIAYLSLADNSIAELPPDFVYMPALSVLNLGGNPLSEIAPGTAPGIHKGAVPLAATLVLQITSIHIATLPGGLITALLASSGRVVYAGSSPLCTSLEGGRDGIDERLVELHSRGLISCIGGGNSRVFPLAATTAQYEICD